MRPKRWIDPSEDRNVKEGDLRIVRLEDGTVRATKWAQYSGSTHGYYADSKGDGVHTPGRNDIAAVGVTWERKRSGPSGPSGKNKVTQRAKRVERIESDEPKPDPRNYRGVNWSEVG